MGKGTLFLVIKIKNTIFFITFVTKIDTPWHHYSSQALRTPESSD